MYVGAIWPHLVRYKYSYNMLYLFCSSPDQECQQIFKANFPIDTETIKAKVRQENQKHTTRGKRRIANKETKHTISKTHEKKRNFVADVG